MLTVFYLLYQESSQQINESVDELMTFSAPIDSLGGDVTESSRHQLFYVINGLRPDMLYSASLRMSNVFGFGNWTDSFFFETAEGQLHNIAFTIN